LIIEYSQLKYEEQRLSLENIHIYLFFLPDRLQSGWKTSLLREKSTHCCTFGKDYEIYTTMGSVFLELVEIILKLQDIFNVS